MRVTEEDVVRMASLWAARNGQSAEMAASAALEAIDGLKQTHSGEHLMAALENLYRQYEARAQD